MNSFDANNDKEENSLLNENVCESDMNNPKDETKKNISYFEFILKYRNKMNINYTDYDFQKGESSPRLLFRKRKNDYSEGQNYSATKLSKNSFDILHIDRNNFNQINSNNSSSILQNPNIFVNNEIVSINQTTNSSITNSNSQNNVSNLPRNNNSQLSNSMSLSTNKISTNKEKDGNNEINFSNTEDRYINNNKIFKIHHDHVDHKNINKIKTTFENYLDVVHDSYFAPEEGNWSNNNNTFNNANSSINVNQISSSVGGDALSRDEDDNCYVMNNNNSKNSEKRSNYFQSTNTSNNISNNTILNCFNTTNQANPNLFKFSSLDLLINPLRQKFIWESWSPYEIALFECCICKFGKNFDLYPKIVNNYKLF